MTARVAQAWRASGWGPRLIGRVFVGALLLLAGCDAVNLDKLHPGSSTDADVLAIMGPPTMRWQDADGSQTWEYARMPQGVVNYMIDFGPDQVVRAIRQALNEENMARVRPGMDRAAVRRLLGQPASESELALKHEHVWSWQLTNGANSRDFFDVYFTADGRVVRSGRSAEYGH